METTTESTTKLSAIDKALAAAKARAAVRAGAETTIQQNNLQPKAKKETHPAFEKAQKAEALKASRDAAKAVRDADREARRAAKTAASENEAKKGTHMKKVDKAGSKLPSLSESAQLTFNEITTNFGREAVAAIALHLQHFNRVKATELAAGRTYKQGQVVRITGGDPRYIGLQGTVDAARPLRCFINVPGFRKPVYLFTSDIEPVTEEPATATGTEG